MFAVEGPAGEHIVEIQGDAKQVQSAQALTSAFMISPGASEPAAAAAAPAAASNPLPGAVPWAAAAASGAAAYIFNQNGLTPPLVSNLGGV